MAYISNNKVESEICMVDTHAWIWLYNKLLKRL